MRSKIKVFYLKIKKKESGAVRVCPKIRTAQTGVGNGLGSKVCKARCQVAGRGTTWFAAALYGSFLPLLLQKFRSASDTLTRGCSCSPDSGDELEAGAGPACNHVERGTQ